MTSKATNQNKTSIQTPFPCKAILELVLALCFTVLIILQRLPYEYIDFNKVPTTVIFKGRPTTFHSFIICIVFSFSGATSALIVSSHKPRFARFCGYYSMASMYSAFLILSWAVYCECIN
ncbi:hypothetical protein RIF29_21409 [Crotalaria pallida]|uniref:Uncharacterized protein n=1 Tax=Crotalaria pallida TaxID=3830 RepID=A0AAN9I5X5_CROPI